MKGVLKPYKGNSVTKEESASGNAKSEGFFSLMQCVTSRGRAPLYVCVWTDGRAIGILCDREGVKSSLAGGLQQALRRAQVVAAVPEEHRRRRRDVGVMAARRASSCSARLKP